MSKRTKREAFQKTDSHCVFCGKDLLESLDSFITSSLVRTAPPNVGYEEIQRTNLPACGVCRRLKDAARLKKGEPFEVMAAAIEVVRQQKADHLASLRSVKRTAEVAA